MKALVLKTYGNLEYTEVPLPEMGPDDVLIRVKACGICGSDVHGLDGSTGRRQPPVIMGHEAAGIIEDTGSNVSAWKSGDRVTFDSTIYCGNCWFCNHGRINLCDNRRVLGVSCDDYRQNGAFAQYVSVPQHVLYRLPDGLSFAHASMVEAVSVAVHAVGRISVSPGDTAVVVGAGMIGLFVVQALRVAGCAQIVAADIDRGRLDLALNLGATTAVKVDESDLTAQVAALTQGRGADLAFEVVGMTPTLQSAIQSLRKGGSLTLVGNISANVELPLQAVVTEEISLLGSCASAGEYPECLDLIASGQIDIKPLISAVAPLSDGDMWFKRLYNKEPGLMKVILCPD